MKKPTYEELEKRIQEMEKAEEESLQSYELLSNLARLVPGVIYQYHLYQDGRSAFPYASPGMNDIYEVTPEAVREDATPVYARLHPDDYDHVVDAIRKSAATLETFYCEFRVILPRQGLRWRWSQAHPRRMPDGSTLWHGIISDITERKQAEEKLQMAHEKFLTVLDGINATIYVADMKTHEILFMNKHMIEAFGRDMTGETCFKSFRGKPEPCSLCTNDQLIDGNGKPTGVCIRQNKNPLTKRTYINHDRAIEWVDNRLVRLQIATDITEFKKMETQLRQTQKMEAIGVLAGGIAHDFNNILFPIVGHVELLLEDVPEDGPFRKSLNEIYTSALRARDLVRQILAFSRQRNAELTLIKMQPIIKEALKLIRSTIPAIITIHQDLKSDCGTIKADPIQIHQIVMNLATNAFHAMEKNGGDLKVNLKEIELNKDNPINQAIAPGPYACLTVADTGMGMDKAVINKIFDPFFTTKEKGKGTGMGLSVVHGIVKNLGGAIQVDSDPGKGTVFNVYFPISGSDSGNQEMMINEPLKGGTEHILLVDDEKAIIKMEKKVLERLGYRVTAHAGSLEALEAFRDHPEKFDLVVTDMAMPSMSGDKLAVEMIRLRPGIPILLCTGYSENLTEAKIQAEGIRGLLMKPIIIKDLAKKLRDILDGNKPK